MATYKLTSVKGDRSVDGSLIEAVEAARQMAEELQPAYGVTIENESGQKLAVVDDGEVELEDGVIEVLGVGKVFDLLDDCEQDSDMEWYGTVRVSIDGVEYQVGAVIGVPESDRGSCRAAGSGVRPFLRAWYADSSDWESASASEGTPGIPQQFADTVIAEIDGAVHRLWAER